MKNIRKQEETPVSVVTDSGVQRDSHRCLTRQTPVPEATESGACPAPAAITRRCRCCFCELPLSAFYTRSNSYTPDSYCKECRKTAGRLRRKGKACRVEAADIPPRYPVITRIEDPEVRMALILHALHTVRESAVRKCKRRREDEFLRERFHNLKSSDFPNP